MSAKMARGQTGWLPTLKRWLLIFLVMNLVGAAVALFLENGLGSDSIGLLCDGLHRMTGLSYGNASMLYNLAIIAAAAVFARGNLGAGTIVYALTSGYFIDFYCWLMDPFTLGGKSFPPPLPGFRRGTDLPEPGPGHLNSDESGHERPGCPPDPSLPESKAPLRRPADRSRSHLCGHRYPHGRSFRNRNHSLRPPHRHHDQGLHPMSVCSQQKQIVSLPIDIPADIRRFRRAYNAKSRAPPVPGIIPRDG